VPEPHDWTSVADSKRIIAECYLPEQEIILVRFPGGVEWQYKACPASEWAAFTAPGQSRGAYIAETLDFKPNCRWVG
jgi:hypothetical protein